MIKSKWYTKNKYFKQEVKTIFKKDWIFACLQSDVIKNNDFVTIEIGNISIVVQNFRGKLVAFQNVCSHRFKRIQTEKKGNRPFVCGYHGWSYNKDGVPRIPKKETFDIKDDTCLHLKKYQLEVCGAFVFVNLNKNNSISLKTFLGDFYLKLENLSTHFNTNLNRDKVIPHNCNWKLLVENVLEGYHCPLVHQDSLVSLGYCLDAFTDLEYSNKHISSHSPKVKTANDKDLTKLQFLESLSFKHDSFYHMFVYPNLFISSTSGSFYYVGQLLPKTKNKTELLCRFIGPNYNIDLSKKEHSINKAMFTFNADSTVKIINEDKPLVESCQKGLEETKKTSLLLSNTEEVRVSHFHKTIITNFKNTNV